LAACWLLVTAVGCGGDQEDGAAGSDCYRDADCKAGLVCVPNAAGERVCSNDTTPLVSQVAAPPAPPEELPIEDAGVDEADAAAPVDPDAAVADGG
jgi:hypothetical protein